MRTFVNHIRAKWAARQLDRELHDMQDGYDLWVRIVADGRDIDRMQALINELDWAYATALRAILLKHAGNSPVPNWVMAQLVWPTWQDELKNSRKRR